MRRIGLGLFIIGITFAKAHGQEDYGPVNTGQQTIWLISADARSAAIGSRCGGSGRSCRFFIMVRQLYQM